ncbi:MAG: hypothetical protein ACRC7S_18560 [Cetobacterium sp.]
MNEVMIFEGNNVEIIELSGKPMFELYSTGMALGYVKISKGILYPRKDRIETVLKNAEITTFPHGVEKYIDLNGLRKFISLSNTTNKGRFIFSLQNKGYLKKEEVFEYSRKEIVLMDSLARILNPMGYTLETQKKFLNYRLDGYVPELDLVIEYDENSHSNYDLEKEYAREFYIRYKYSHLIRVTDNDDLMTNIGKIINRIVEVA